MAGEGEPLAEWGRLEILWHFARTEVAAGCSLLGGALVSVARGVRATIKTLVINKSSLGEALEGFLGSGS